MDLEVHPSKHKLSAMRQEKGGGDTAHFTHVI